MKKIYTIVRKEWKEVFRNKMVIFTVAFLPLLLTAIPLVMLYVMRDTVSADEMDSGMPTELTDAMCADSELSGSDCLQVYLVSEFMMMFMIIPVAIPVTMASYSIVGEKTTRSLEPLLATPITTVELLTGKCLSTVIPAIIATFGAFGIFALGSWILVDNKSLLMALLNARWLMAVFVVGPLLAIMAVIFALMVSSRVSDPRVAEQVSMVIIVPVLAGFFAQMAGVFVLNVRVVSIVAVVMLLLDILLAFFATRVFQRESILTRWK